LVVFSTVLFVPNKDKAGPQEIKVSLTKATIIENYVIMNGTEENSLHSVANDYLCLTRKEKPCKNSH